MSEDNTHALARGLAVGNVVALGEHEFPIVSLEKKDKNSSRRFITYYLKCTGHVPYFVKLRFGPGAQDRAVTEGLALEHIAAHDPPENVPHLHSYGRFEDGYFVVLPHLEAQELVASDERLTAEALAPRLEETASALTWCHDQGIAHADVKIENLLVNSTGTHLTDFDMAHFLTDAPQDIPTLPKGCLLGSPYYMPPEVIRHSKYSGRADQYALGVSAYKTLTGLFPFEGVDAHMIMYSHLDHHPKHLTRFNTAIKRSISRVVLKALSKKPEKRFGSCVEFSQAFTEALEKPDTPWWHFLS